jgi:hypothetical protein
MSSKAFKCVGTIQLPNLCPRVVHEKSLKKMLTVTLIPRMGVVPMWIIHDTK